MIIGNGDIASVLKEIDDDDFLFFVSGVSDSNETDYTEFDREVRLLMKQTKEKHIIYISTLSSYFKNSPYTMHKRWMETTIERRWPDYTILRIGNITWGENRSTLINYLKNNPEAPIQDVYRHILTKESFLFWVNAHKPHRGVFDITGETIKVQEIKNRIDKGEL